MVEADDAVYAMTHLWWHEDRTPESTRSATTRPPSSGGRARVLAAADVVIPGTGRRSGRDARRSPRRSARLGRAVREDVEPDVVDRRLGSRLGDRVDERVALVGGGSRSRWAPRMTVRRYVAQRLAGLDRRRLVVEPGPTSMKPAASSRRVVVLRRRERPRPEPAVAHLGEHAWTAAMLPAPPHCATSRPPGPQDRGQVPEQRLVVRHPVERRRRQDRVDARVADRQRRSQVRDHVAHAVAEPGEPLAGRLDHRGRPVERHDPAARQALDQPLRDPARAAAGVEHRLVAPQRQPVQHVGAPAGHRVRDAVVGRARPSPSACPSRDQPPARRTRRRRRARRQARARPRRARAARTR